MSCLLIVFNLSESMKRGTIILETYSVYKIKKNKDDSFSGLRTKIDISNFERFDNFTFNNLEKLKADLHRSGNFQFNNYQYLIHSDNVSLLSKYVVLGNIFYEDKKNLKFVDSLSVDKDKEFHYFIDKSQVNIFVKDSNELTSILYKVKTNFYIDLSNNEGTLFFELNNQEIKYNGKVKNHNEQYDYHIEKIMISALNKEDWIFINEKSCFRYEGKDIATSLFKLQEAGINLFTQSEKKKISSCSISNQSISYNMNWFEINGTIDANDKKYDLEDLINLRNKHSEWIAIDDNIIFLPSVVSQNADLLKKMPDGKLGIEKKYVGQVIALSSELKVDHIKNIENLIDFSNIELHIDSKIKSLLKDYQILGVRWLLYLYQNGFGGCLADDMGLGKTVQVIAYLSDKLFLNKKNLIIVPKTLLLNWEKEIKKFLPNMSYYIYHGVDRSLTSINNSQVIITTYGVVMNDFEKLSSVFFENIIIDEAQNIKNIKTNSYNSIFNLKGKIKILLTGTPFENNIMELWSLMHLINPDIFTSKRKYSVDYISQDRMISSIKKSISPFILRRIKKDVLNELPEKSEETILCTMSENQEKLYNKMLKSIKYELQRKNNRYEIKSSSIMLEGLLYLQQICCHPKLLSFDLNPERILESCKTDVLFGLVTNLIANGHKVVIFSRFTKMLGIIQDILKEIKINLFYLDGKTANRMKIIEDFEKSPSWIFLVSLKAGGVGLTLTSADVAIIYDPWWNPAVEKQAEDRIYRIGQTKNVTIYRLIVANTLEEKIEELKCKKKEIASGILENEDTVTGLNFNELKELLFE